jgi:aspartate/methionine/tyrosine aminotransferase
VGRRAARLAPLELAGLTARARAVGAADIAIGTPPGQPPSAAIEAAAEAMRQGHNQYADPSGFAGLRAVVAGRVAASGGVAVDPDSEVTVVSGSTEGILVALLTLTDPGDEVVVIEPAFEIYDGAVELAGCTRVPVVLQAPDWRLDVDRLAAAFTERTAAVIVNTPHNPTGRAFSREELALLLDLCARRQVACVADEVYADFVFDGAAHVTALDFPEHRARVVVVGSLSKANEMTGWRLGYCVAEPELTASLRRVHERTTFGSSTPLQHGAAALARASCGPERFQGQRDEMVRRLAAMGFEVTAPEGGWFVLSGTERLGWPSDELADRLLDQAGVLVAPGKPFFHDPAEGRRWIRTTFVKDPALQSRALDAVEAFLARNPR